MGELSKDEAAKYLGCSARQVERLTSENRLGVRYVKGRAKPSPRYDEGELARFKAETERATERPAVQILGPEPTRHDATGEGAALSVPVASEEALQVLAGRMLAMILQAAQAQGDTNRPGALPAPSHSVASGKAQVPTADKLLLSLDEAQAITGLSKAHLRAAIAAGSLRAARAGRAWKIRRENLANYLAEVFP